MNSLKTHHTFVSAATAFTFIPTMITSVLLLFHIRFPGITDIHQWVGLAFVVMCCLHIPINWKRLQKHFTEPGASTAMILSIILTISMGIMGAMFNDGHPGREHGFSRGHAMLSER